MVRAMVLSVLLALGCTDTPRGGDGGVGATCQSGLAGSCVSGLMCCVPCRGIPYPPDFGAVYGTCAEHCQQQLCP